MILSHTGIAGSFLLDVERREDERGFFARTYCRTELEEAGINFVPVQSSVSFNRLSGTLRGMHYQLPPHEECKIVRCTSGAIWDVVVDLRPGSPSHLRWFGVELHARAHRALYVPAGCAHGFVTLTAETEVLYDISVAFTEGTGLGVRWDDPVLAIDWPIRPVVISDRDRSWPSVQR